ncbi:hypothetical protein L1787_16645 [Acuticoccus sp. M5D2P5]|uniref:hypothetical protein n=1 Tax=Acuticoccus kalidii TaxID=2910977 RepID=UPI001F26BC15|nr:hypothetical protein [Acuticoccus kalidii]MCF3935034.1 hypothetical protein [Acuticoccus kalidii]
MLAEYGVEIVPNNVRRPELKTYAGATLEHLLDRHGEGHLRLVLTSIVETTNNKRALIEPVITAVSWLILNHPRWVEDTSRWLDEMDKINLLALFDQATGARGEKVAPVGSRNRVVYGLLHDRLKDRLGEGSAQGHLDL